MRCFTKYADDSSLLVPENHDVGLYDELQNVLKWAEVNKMQVNMAKTKEIVFHRPNARNVLLPFELPGIERVLCAKLLGVWLQADMGMKKYVEYIVHFCNERTYLLTQLKWHRLPPVPLQIVFDTIILVRVLYALPAWRGYMHLILIACSSCLLKAQRWQL